MPSVWQARFTGCWWLLAYCAIHSWLLRPPSMACDYTPALVPLLWYAIGANTSVTCGESPQARYSLHLPQNLGEGLELVTRVTGSNPIFFSGSRLVFHS